MLLISSSPPPPYLIAARPRPWGHLIQAGYLMTVKATLRVAVVLPPKKWKKHGFEGSERIKFIPLGVEDLTENYLRELQVDMVLHKLGDLVLEPTKLLAIREELAKWGGRLVDEIARVSFLNDRRRICKLLEWFTQQHRELGLCLPPTSECTTAPPIAFPLIRKPLVACGVRDSHHMCIYYTPDLLTPSPDFILQQFIPHHSVLYKVYIIGEEVRIQLRPSVDIEAEDQRPRPFNSQTLKHHDTIPPGSERQAEALRRLEPHRQSILNFTKVLQAQLCLTLFGWDLIIEEQTGKLYIIDINYFPGYDEVNFLDLLTETLLNDGWARTPHSSLGHESPVLPFGE